MFATARQTVAALTRSVGPSLRVVGLTYTGLLGILALVAVIGVGLSPVSPALQQVTEPARQAVSEYVQPTSDFVTTIIGAPLHVVITPPLSETRSLAVTVAVQDDRPLGEDDALTQELVTPSEPFAETGVQVELTPVFGPSPIFSPPIAVTDTSIAVDETPSDMPAEDEEPVEVPAEPAPLMIVQPAEPSGLLIAAQETPQSLPSVQPETAAQIKARLDAENAAAIAAAREARARAKAEADVANQAAIDALKAANAAATAVAKGAPSPTPLPTPQPTATTVPQPQLPAVAPVPSEQTLVKQSAPLSAPTAPTRTSVPATGLTGKAAADAANQAAIDAAKSARAKAKSDAEAANQAAIAAARASKAGVTLPGPTPMSSPQPVAPRTAVDAVEIDAPVAADLDGVEAATAEAAMPEASSQEVVAVARADVEMVADLTSDEAEAD